MASLQSRMAQCICPYCRISSARGWQASSEERMGNCGAWHSDFNSRAFSGNFVILIEVLHQPKPEQELPAVGCVQYSNRRENTESSHTSKSQTITTEENAAVLNKIGKRQ